MKELGRLKTILINTNPWAHWNAHGAAEPNFQQALDKLESQDLIRLLYINWDLPLPLYNVGLIDRYDTLDQVPLQGRGQKLRRDLLSRHWPVV